MISAMIDSLGGPKRVNNFLSTLNLKPVSNKNLKKMEVRAGEVVRLVGVGPKCSKGGLCI